MLMIMSSQPSGITRLRSVALGGIVPVAVQKASTSARSAPGGRNSRYRVGSASVVRIGEDFPELNVRFALTPQGPGVDFYEGRGTFGNAGFWVIA